MTKRKNVATLILGLFGSGLCSVLSILAVILFFLADTLQINLIMNVLEQGWIFSMLYAVVSLTHGIVTAFAFWSSVKNGSDSEKGGVFQLITALLACVLPIMYFVANAYILGTLFMLPVIIYLCLGLWSFFAKPDGYITPPKRRNLLVLFAGVPISLLTMIYGFTVMMQVYETLEIVFTEFTSFVWRLTVGSAIIIYSGFLAFIASCICGFKGKNGGIFLIICSLISLAGGCIAFTPSPWITFNFVPFIIFLPLGIWAICTKAKNKVLTQGLSFQTVNQQAQQNQVKNYQNNQFY